MSLPMSLIEDMLATQGMEPMQRLFSDSTSEESKLADRYGLLQMPHVLP